jgi:phage shock protein E
VKSSEINYDRQKGILKIAKTMLQSIKNFLTGTQEDFAAMVKDGAIIVDVRTKAEYSSGHIKGSINIPLDQLSAQLSKLDKEKTIITCCASGMRSSSAKSLLLSSGYKKVYNGGGWGSLEYKLR